MPLRIQHLDAQAVAVVQRHRTGDAVVFDADVPAHAVVVEVGLDIVEGRVVTEVVRLKESHGFLRGLVAVVGFRQAIIPFDRPDGSRNVVSFPSTLHFMIRLFG